MLIYKCKTCGGDLTVQEDATVCQCENCGIRQTLPRVRDEEIQGLFNRANFLLREHEFDKAEKVYERILETHDKEAEAYWGIILCKYGIEYVEDPKTDKWLPTCHRTSYDAIVADGNYKAAIEYADVLRRDIYKAEAKVIDDIQKEALALAQNEEPYDVFICYKEQDENGKRTRDSVIANDIYYQLEQEGLKVFYSAITLEDKIGAKWEPIIFAALYSAKVMIVVGTKAEYFNAPWVKNEWSRFLKMMKNDRSKMLIPCYRDMDAYELPEELAHLQALNMDNIGFITDIVRRLKKVIDKNPKKENRLEKFKDISGAASFKELILPNGDVYMGEAIADKPHGQGKAIGRMYTYEGGWKLGKWDGQGKVVWEKGGEWNGIWKDLKPYTGEGTYYFEKAKYVGAFVNGKQSGKGVCYYANGNRYEGEYCDGNYHGMGVLYWQNGDRYEGEFRFGKPNGVGTRYWEKGGQWKGIWKEGAPYEGDGTLYYEKGRYEGAIVNAKFEGKAKFFLLNGIRYEGEYHEGKRSGEGRVYWKDGSEWSGIFEGDKPQKGEGVYHYDNGYYEGLIVNGMFVGRKGKYYWKNGDVYEGEFRLGKRCGQGEERYASGDRFVGEFENDHKSKGTYYWKKGGTWSGTWKADNKIDNGNGTWYYENGWYTGEVQNGEPNGQGTICWNKGGTWSGIWKNGKAFTGEGIIHHSGYYYVGNLTMGQESVFGKRNRYK